jgi:hypothetical protein
MQTVPAKPILAAAVFSAGTAGAVILDCAAGAEIPTLILVLLFSTSVLLWIVALMERERQSRAREHAELTRLRCEQHDAIMERLDAIVQWQENVVRQKEYHEGYVHGIQRLPAERHLGLV